MSSDDTTGVPVTIAHARRGATRPWLAWFASAAAAVLGFALVYANTVVQQVDAALVGDNIDDLVSPLPGDADPVDSSEGRAINILLLGSDARNGANGDIGGRVAGGMRNDTTIVMHISADRSRIDFVSIPRDAQVKIPECRYKDGSTIKGTEGDFNISFSNGGRNGDPAEAAACVINTVQQMSGLTIDHWAVADFTGFISMIDALGGVPVCVPEKIESKKAKLKLKAGPQVLNGKQALALARMRTAEVGNVSGSDLQRIGRQQDLLMQVMKLALSKNLLTDAPALTQFLRAGAESLTMDEELANTRYLLGLAFSLRDMRTSNINFETIPWKLTDDYLNVIILPGAETMWEDMRNDRPLTETGDNSAGKAWDNAISASPSADPDATDPKPEVKDPPAETKDPQAALLDQCA